MARTKNRDVWIAPDGRVRIANSPTEAVQFRFDGWRPKPPHTPPPADVQADEPDDGAEVTSAAAAKKTARTKTTDK